MEKMIDKFVLIKPNSESSKKNNASSRNLPNSSCLACKARKVKCDSQKPSCSNCIRRNQECTYVTDKSKRKTLTTKREIKKYTPLECTTTKSLQKDNTHSLRYKILRIESELRTYKYLAKHWYNMSLHINNTIGTSTDQDILSWIELDKKLELESPSYIDKNVMLQCIKLFEKKAHLAYPFIKISWDSYLSYEFWNLLISDINSENSCKSRIDIFISNNNIYNLTKLLYYTIIFLYGSSLLKYKILEKHLLNHTKNLIKVIIFEKNACKYSYCANDIVLSLCFLSMYFIQSNNFVAVSSYLLLAYQFVVNHKKDIEPQVVDLYYIIMKYTSIYDTGEFPLTLLINVLGIQPDNSNFTMFCVDGLFLISKLKNSDEINSTMVKDFMKRMENAEKILDEWNKYQGLSIFSLNYRIVLLAFRAEIAYRLGMIEESDKWIDHIVDFVLGTKINLLLRFLNENLVFFKFFDKNYVYTKIFQKLEEKQNTWKQENSINNTNDFKLSSDQQNFGFNYKNTFDDYTNYILYEHF